jgi:hypothetical protein
MADVADTLAEWSSTTGSNAPSGATNIGTSLDDNLRELQGVVVRGLSHKGSDLASSTTPALGATEGLLHDITGTATITGFDTIRSGIWKFVKYEGAIPLTYNASSLILLGGASRTVASGDVSLFFSEGSGNWRELMYSRIDPTATTSTAGISEWATQAEYSAGTASRVVTSDLNGITLGTEVASTSGTSIDFTGFPAGTRRIVIHFVGVSLSGTAGFRIQLGDAGGFENSGYLGSYSILTTGASSSNNTSGFEVAGGSADNVWHGQMVLNLEDSTDFTWTAFHILGASNTAGVSVGAGSKPLSAELTQVRITTTNGTDTFDAGVVNVTYER